MKQPIYTYSEPAVYAQESKERLLALGCSEEYAERHRLDVIERGVQVKTPFDGNAAQCGRLALRR